MEPMLAWKRLFCLLHRTRLPGGPWGSRNLGTTFGGSPGIPKTPRDSDPESLTGREKEQAINRAGIVQEDVQPPGLKVWSDPFGRK